MLFPTLDFILFLAAVVGVYWAVPKRVRVPVIAIASLLFYASWKVSYLPILIGIIVLAWSSGSWLAKKRRHPILRGLAYLALFVPLLNYKYWNWISTNIEILASNLGYPVNLPDVQAVLPIGISFFTFQALAYVVDSNRDGKPESNLGRFATFILFFPQLIAGPIVRRHELLPQLNDPPLLRADQIGAGLFRIGRGMAKKLLIADIVRVGMVDPVFADPTRFGALELLVALYAYTLQIYCDFSGYTDIAIGSARLFGIELPENFRRPYLATSIAAFWRRWHITLSNWVRDYIYFGLGGAQVSTWKVYRNFMITFIVIGIWHGASWNFVIYGSLHGLASCINRYQRKKTGRKPDDPLPSVWAWTWRFLLTFHFVVFARILFRAPDLATSWTFAQGLWSNPFAMPRFSVLSWVILFVGFAIHFSPMKWQPKAERTFVQGGPIFWALVLALVGVCSMLVGTGEQLNFIYYQF